MQLLKKPGKAFFSVVSTFLASKNLFLAKSLTYLSRKKRINTGRLDYVRYSTLELIAHEIYNNNIQGNVAEVGVYQGDFAKDLNVAFPDRKLYLFDTFEGFNEKDISTENINNYSTGVQNFKDTSVETVLKKMLYRAQCIIKKGYFPESAAGLEDNFCFVSLDADLFEPIYAGLRYFYPRLAKGGYIFIHDFNNDEYKGSREAVIKFCTETGCIYTPIADIGGTAIIGK
jgi:O-methyltransferase